MRWLDRLTTRAASGETRALPGAGAGMGNTISNAAATNGPVKAGTAPITYSGPGTPLIPEFSGQAVIQNGYEQSVWVARGLQTIAETIAALPFVAGMDPDNPAITNPQAPLARLLGPATPRAPGGPNPQWSSQQYWNWQTLQKLATGKMAAELQVDKIAKGPDGKSPAIVGLWPLVSYLLNPISSAGGGTTYFDGFQYQLPTGVRDLKPEQVFYAWKKSLTDPRQPESLLRSAGLPISISVAIERYTWALLQNGMVATHVVTSAPLEEPDMRRAWEEQFVSNFTGFDQAGKPIFAYADVENGKVTDAFNIQSIAQTSQQAELLAMAGWVKNEILVALGVPESLIGNACLKADEMVRLADGSRRKAADLVGSTFEVLTSTPDGPQVRDAYASWNDVEPCYAVTTESGRQLMCNARHPLFAATHTKVKDVVRGRPGRPKAGESPVVPRGRPGVTVRGWTRLEDLAIGDLLAVTTEYPIEGTDPLTVDEATVLGALIGDGCSTGTNITLTSPYGPDVEVFTKAVRSLGDEVRLYKNQPPRCDTWGVSGGAVRKLLRTHGLLGVIGHEKFVPSAVFAAPRPVQVAFLQGLYGADGCAHTAKSKVYGTQLSYERPFINLTSVSDRLVRDVQELLLRFGVMTRLVRQSHKGGMARMGDRRFESWRVVADVPVDVVRFCDAVGIPAKQADVDRVRQIAVEQIDRGRARTWRTMDLNPGLRWEKIKSIEPVGVDATVAITVPDGNTYLSTFWEHNSQRIYANADSEERTFWSGRVINTVAELQDDINTFLAPKLGPEVGWFDLSRVSALQPPTPFMQPQLTDLINAGIMTVAEAQQQLGVADSGFIDTSDVLLGEESSTGTSIAGKASAPIPELRGWTWEHRGMNLNTYRSGTWRRLVHQRERIVVRPPPAPVIDVASTPLDTRGYDKALEVLATVTSLREKRTPETPAASTVHNKLGTHGLWRDKSAQLPAYIQNVARAFIAKGMPESEAIAQSVGVVRDWAEGKTAHGHVHPDVQAAAAKAIAEWDALKASHNKSKRSDRSTPPPAALIDAAVAESARSGDENLRAVAEFGPGGAGSTFSGNNPDASGAGLMLPIAEGLKPKPREAELIGPHRYTPNVRDAKHCAKCGKGPLAKVHKDWAAVKQATPQRSSVAAVEALLGRPVESRHRGPDHVHVPTGHANTPVRKRQAMKAAHKQALAGYEAAFTGPMRDLFAKQEKSALVRLTGRRGRQMVKRAQGDLEARASSQPGPDDPTTAPTSEPATPQPASVDPAALLPADYWIAQTAKALEGPYNHVADASTSQVRGQLGGAVSEEANSLSAAQVKAALRARAATVSSSITNTTYQAIAKTLGDGITSGESIPQLAERVKTVFADANDNRAALIARTEAGSASNTAQMTYAQSLPQGIVAGKEWLAVHDTRTRHDHHLADGQRQPLGVPFRVGGYAMDRPGDPAAPPSETINCRCTTAFIPQSQSHLLLQQPPKDFTYNPQAPTAA